jgi:hypothetical protein
MANPFFTIGFIDQSQLDRIDANVKSLLAAITTLKQSVTLLQTEEQQMAIDLNSLTAEVANNTSVTNSVVTLLNNLTAMIKAIPPSTDPTTQAALEALVATLTANDQTAAAAVVNNTPAAPAAPAG